ncbi:hypothetical protein J5N97_010247 [Dioscorea zingiberensis]|uniref:TPX2 C-terminal domain-containing protein n=1 Tax=Dioscorea zingiberensis TaxID=325984 RepID=A0A9D5HNF4_9LILI|nr:hypothetical protein J5N97_010247 [Dioscorea zingiberensis]
MTSLPDSGSGRVKHLVKAFESMLSISKDGEGEKVEESRKRVMNWALPGLQPLVKNVNNEESSVSVFSSAEFLPTRFCSSMDSNNERLSLGSRTSSGSRRSRRNSTDSTGRNWCKKLKVTSQHPFKLRTECLVKPPIKESTEPIDLVLHSDVRAAERAEFDNFVAERLSFAEQLKLEREKQQKCLNDGEGD